MDVDIEAEVSVKDIVNFYIKINNPDKAKKDIAKLSSKDKLTALEHIVTSQAAREFKVEVAKYFLYDLDNRVRRKCELAMEDLVPGWVTDPAESILRLLKSSDSRGGSRKNAAVRFLFGIVDSCSLRDTFMSLLNGRNRAHMVEIIAILEDYIECSNDEQEQVNIFDACLDIVLFEDADHNIKHHASNLLSVFFKKVAATELGETLRQKYIERQLAKADGIYSYLCSGTAGLNSVFLEDLLRPLEDGGKAYQVKILTYFGFIIEKIRNPAEVDNVLDIYPDYWNKDEPTKEEKIQSITKRIVKAVEELWDTTDDKEVRELIVRIRYNEHSDKRELLEQIKARIDSESLSRAALEKVALMLRCFLQPNQDEGLRLLAANLLLFKVGDQEDRLAGLEQIRSDAESGNLSTAENGSIIGAIETLLNDEQQVQVIQDLARYIVFITDPERLQNEEQQKAVLGYLRPIVERSGFSSEAAEKRVLQSLEAYINKIATSDKLKKAAQYLKSKIKTPKRD